MIKRVTLVSLTTPVRVVTLCGAPTAPAAANQTPTRTTIIAPRRRQRWTARLVTALLLVAAGLLVSPPVSYAGGPKLTVMTRNLYLGTALDNVVAASNEEEFVQAVSQDWAHVVATDFPTRAKALAAEILRAKPDVVGLQEVSLWRDQTPSNIVTGTAGPNAPDVKYDFLAFLQAELAAGGTAYTAVSTSTNADVEAPRSNPDSLNGYTDVRLTDRDVILVRSELAGKFSGAESGHYTAQFSVPSAVGPPLTFTRGWASINYRHDANRTVRIVVTHLEIEAGPAGAIQIAQGDELLEEIADDPNVVVLADINSAADCSTTDTYKNLTEELVDAWWINRPNECDSDGPRKVSRPGGGNLAGLSCCMNELLDNSTSTATTRIDVVLSKGALTATSATATGNVPFRRSPAPLWASDHFGVVAQLELAK
jgi:endonuclease/exonuclease/phosphatase family metal-dependent hydrolase